MFFAFLKAISTFIETERHLLPMFIANHHSLNKYLLSTQHSLLSSQKNFGFAFLPSALLHPLHSRFKVEKQCNRLCNQYKLQCCMITSNIYQKQPDECYDFLIKTFRLIRSDFQLFHVIGQKFQVLSSISDFIIKFVFPITSY